LTQRPGGGQVGLLFADIDELKAINDTYGHGAGDAVIREVARRFCSAVRPGAASRDSPATSSPSCVPACRARTRSRASDTG
jgi:hypothetical protein